MAEPFRLLSATMPWSREANDASRHVNLAPVAASDSSWTSVVIGRNGVGKSRLLGAVTAAFDGVQSGRRRRGAGSITYQIGGDRCGLEIVGNEVRAVLNDVQVAPELLPLPRRVIAVTAAPFDKFRLPRRVGPHDSPRQDGSIYRYLGLRDHYGRASATAPVYRALNELFAASSTSELRRGRIASVFEHLGYRPSIEVRYRWTVRGRSFSRALASGAVVSSMEWQPRSSYPSAYERLTLERPEIAVEISQITREAGMRDGGTGLLLRADFENESVDGDLFNRLQLLRRAEFIDIDSVFLSRRDNGLQVDLRDTSSGELALVTSLLGVASSIEDSSLIVIDEPEISLHPEWQTQYLDLLTRTVGQYRGCHFVVATHSPLIVSDISATDTSVISLDPHAARLSDTELSGQSTDYILLRAFGVANENNLHLKQMLVNALRLAADGEIAGDEFNTILDNLKSIASLLDRSGRIQRVVSELEHASEMSKLAK